MSAEQAADSAAVYPAEDSVADDSAETDRMDNPVMAAITIFFIYRDFYKEKRPGSPRASRSVLYYLFKSAELFSCGEHTVQNHLDAIRAIVEALHELVKVVECNTLNSSLIFESISAVE